MQQRATEAKRVPQARLVAAKAKLAWHAAHPEESATYRAKTLATQQTDAHRAKVSKKMASWHAENPESSAAQQNTRRRVMQSTAYRAGRSLIAKQLTAQGRIGVRAGTKFPPSHCLSIGAAKDVWWAEHSDAKWMCKAGEKAVRVVQEKQPTLLLSGWTYGMKVKGN